MPRNHQDGLRYLSHAFSAPIVATPVFVVLAFLSATSIMATIISLFFATLLPLTGIIGFARSEGSDYDIPERQARTRPFAVAILSYLTGFIILAVIKTSVLISGLMLAYFINTSVMSLITLQWKISVHAAGVTGPLSFLVFRLGPVWGLFYLLVVPVGLLRILLRQHTVLQVLSGAFLSAALTWVEIIFLVPLIPH